METQQLNEIRRKALDRIDASKKAATRLVIAAAAFEGVALIAILVLIDFSQRLHLLIFLCACLVYAPLSFGVYSLRAFIDMSTQRILRAIELGELGNQES